MSDRGGASLGTAEGRITVDASQAINSLNQVGNALSSFDAKAAQVGGTTSQFTQSTVGLAQGMQHIGRVSVGLGATLAAPFVGAVKTAADFEQGMANVNAVMDITDSQFTDLSDLALQLGKDTVFSADEAALGIETLGKAGLDYESIMGGAAQAVTDLAAAGQTTIPRAAEVTAAAMNAFNLTGEDTVRIADAIAGAANASQSDVNQMGIGLAQVSGVAAAANMNLEETAAFMAILADNGLSGSDAATSMKTAILALLSPTQKAAEEMAGLGIDLLDVEGNFIGLEGASRQFFDAWKRSGQTMSEFMDPLSNVLGRDAVRTILFGMQAIESELTGVGKGFNDYEAAVTDAGVAQRIAEERMDSTLGAIEKLRGSLSTLATLAAAPALGLFKPLIEGADALVDAMTSIPQPILAAGAAFSGIIGILTAVGGAFLLVGGYVLEATARMAAAGFPVSRLVGLLGGLGLALAAVTGAIAIAGLAWENNWFGVADKIRELVEDFQFFQKVGAESGDFMSDLANNIHGVGQAIDVVTGNIADISRLFDLIAKAVDPVATLAENWDDFMRSIRVSKASVGHATELGDTIDAIGHALDFVLGTNISDYFTTAAFAIDRFGQVFAEMTGIGIPSAIAAIGALGAALEFAFGPTALSEGLQNLSEVLGTGAAMAAETAAMGYNNVASALFGVGAALDAAGLEGLANQFYDAAIAAQQFADVFRSVNLSSQLAGYSGLSSAILALGEALRQVIGIDITGFTERLATAIEVAENAFFSARQRGVDPFRAALLGIDAALDTVLDEETQARLNGISEAFQNVANAVGETLGSGLDRLGQFFSELGTAISAGDFEGVLESVRSLVSDITTELQSMGERAIDWTINVGVPELIGWAKENAGNAGAWIKEQLGLAADFAGEVLATVQGWVINVLTPTLTGWIDAARAEIGPRIQAAANFAGEVLGNVQGWILNVLTPTLQGFVSSAFAIVQSLLNEYLPKAGDVLGTISGWVLEVGIPTIKQVATEAGSIANQIKTWINEQIVFPDVSELPEIETKAQAFGESLATGITEAISAAVEGIFGGGGTAGGGVRAGFGGTASIAAQFGGGIEATAMQSAEAIIGGFLKGFGAGIAKAMGQENVATFITTGDFEPLKEQLLTAAGDVLAEIPDLLGALVDNTKAELGAIWEGMMDISSWLQEGTGTGAQQGRAAALGGDTLTRGEGLASGIEQAVRAIVDTIAQFFRDLPGMIAKALGATNPFDGALDTLSGWIQEFGNGIDALLDDVSAHADRAAEGFREAIATITGQASEQGPAQEQQFLQSGLDQGINWATEYTKGFHQGAAGTVQTLVPDTADSPFGQVGSSAAMAAGEAAQNGIQSAEGEVVETTGNVFTDFLTAVVEGALGGGAPGVAVPPIGAKEGQDAGEAILDAPDFEGGFSTGFGAQVAMVGQNVDVETPAAQLTQDVGTALDAAMATSIGALSLEQFSIAIGERMQAAIMEGITGASAEGGGSFRGGTGTIGIGIAEALAASIADSDFSAVGTAIQTKIGESLSTGAAEGGEAGGDQAAGAAGGLGNSVATAIAGQIGQADFTAVGLALQAKIGSALSVSAQESSGAAGEAVSGAAGGLGASIATAIATQIGPADFTLVGQAIQLKIASAVGTATAEGGEQVGGAAGGLGAAVAQSIAADIGSADFGAVGQAIMTAIGSSLGQATGNLQGAMQAVMQAVVAAGQQAASQAQAIGQTVTQFIGSGIGSTAGTPVAATQAAVTTAIAGGMGVAPQATTIGQAMMTNAGSGVGAATGTLVSAVQAGVQAGIDGGNSAAAGATVIGQTMMTQAGAGVGGATGSLTAAVGAAVQAGIDAGVAAGAGAVRIGENIVAGIVAGINSGAGAVAEAVRTIVAAGIAAGQQEAASESPSKKTRDLIGIPLAQGIEVGMLSGEDAITAAGKRVVKSAIGSATSLLDAADEAKNLGSEFANVTGFSRLGDQITEIGNRIRDGATQARDGIRELTKGMADELRSGADRVGRESAALGAAASGGLSAAGGAEKPSRDQFKQAKSIVGDLKKMKADIQTFEAMASQLDKVRGFHTLGDDVREVAAQIETHRASALDSAKGLMRDLNKEFNEQLRAFRKAGKDVGDSISEGISEGVSEATTTATESTQSMTESMIQQLNPNLSRLPEMANALGTETGGAISEGLTASEPAVTEAASGVGSAVGSGLESGIPAAESAANSLASTGDTVTQGLESSAPEAAAAATGVVEGTTAAMDTAASEQSDFARTIGELISTTFGEGFASGSDPTASLEMVQGYHDGIRNAVLSLVPQVQQQGSQIGNAFSSGVDSANPTQSGKGLVDEVATGVNTGVGAASDAASRAGTQIGDSLQSSIDDACAPVNADANELTDSCIPKGIEAGENTASKVAQDAGENISENLVDGLDVKKKDVQREFSLGGESFGKSLASGIGGTVNDAVNSAQGVANRAGNVDGSQDGKSVGTSFGQGIAQGITQMIPAIEEAARKAVKQAEEAAKDEGKSKSPSELFAAIGRDLSLGMALGMEQGADAIISASERIVDVTAGVFSGAGVRQATREFDLSMDRYTSRIEQSVAFADRALDPNKLPRSIRNMGTAMGEAIPRPESPDPVVVEVVRFGDVIVEADSETGQAALALIDMLESSSGQYGA